MDEDSDRSLTLTDSGLEVAQRIYERHKLLTDIFEKLGVPSDTARDDACRIEHDLSATTFDAIKASYTRICEKLK
ncbi:MAG: metal-dependent transcriptional regulator, partial [Clostridia bacterium]|nr:metal-dependent transcriptional regulator [Clostridia bacterium]